MRSTRCAGPTPCWLQDDAIRRDGVGVHQRRHEGVARFVEGHHVIGTLHAERHVDVLQQIDSLERDGEDVPI